MHCSFQALCMIFLQHTQLTGKSEDVFFIKRHKICIVHLHSDKKRSGVIFHMNFAQVSSQNRSSELSKRYNGDHKLHYCLSADVKPQLQLKNKQEISVNSQIQSDHHCYLCCDVDSGVVCGNCFPFVSIYFLLVFRIS